MTIGQAGKQVGLTVRTIRYYERLGLVTPSARSPAGYRLYGEREVQQLRFVKYARELGLPLRRIASVAQGSSCCEGMRPELRSALLEQISWITDQIAALGTLKGELERRSSVLRRRPFSDHTRGCHCLDPVRIQGLGPESVGQRKVTAKRQKKSLDTLL